MENSFAEDADKLWSETEEWKKTWKHRKPCKEWKEQRWCKHYVDARYRKFRERIKSLFALEARRYGMP